MNILVPIKRVVDPNVRVRVNAAGVIDTTGLKMSINPFDECALEKALQLREAGVAGQVTVLTCGPAACQDVLRTALAMGADDAVLIDTADATPLLDSYGVARLLQAYMATREYGLVLCGKQAIDDDIGGVAAMLAGLLDWPQALDASALEISADGWQASCGDDSGTASWALSGPSVVSADLRLAEPRRVSLPNIVKAKQKPLAVLDYRTLGVELAPLVKTDALSEPPVREAGIRVSSVAALIDALAAHEVFNNSEVAA
ncbi:electron transfer flavoprotein subunit beta/FixA family protein [Paraburkholderia sp. Ac-20342]|uniref:electron transfer flavoprotein subunit beta/FixA family protein n=1 Tax=Paraburkholderia sp. Ac-20342 TaxID=2703889 RepID=UPI00197DC475|nr:electron transfer flavoprotein subunit beta/FixA family protein [Paraburkholderia sp. Ac-20342]